MKEVQLAVLEADNISVRIQDKQIIDQVGFSVQAGEFIGIIGPNGAGKSTLMRALRGLVPLAAGRAAVFGKTIAGMGEKEAARKIAYMQQEVNLGFGFSALEVVLAGRYPYLKWWQNENAEDVRIAKKYMAFTGVEALAERSVQQVSGGERQRILLAKVLAQETPVILLDEPTASLDLLYQEEIFRYCQVMCRQGKTILMIAHDLKLAAKFCSRLLLLAGGRIVADGTPADVVTSANLEAAYGLHSAVFVNQITGSLDIHTFAAAGSCRRSTKVHIIGGGGSAGNVIRTLYEQGFCLSGGVFQAGDTDADAAQAFEVDVVIGRPFAAIDGEQGRENREKIEQADWTVLTNLCYGEANLDNLQAAFSARQLVVLEDSPVSGRDFTGGRASELYRILLTGRQVSVKTTAEFLSHAAGGKFAPAEERGQG